MQKSVTAHSEHCGMITGATVTWKESNWIPDRQHKRRQERRLVRKEDIRRYQLGYAWQRILGRFTPARVMMLLGQLLSPLGQPTVIPGKTYRRYVMLRL